jgi:intraflagellar transport protein 46
MADPDDNDEFSDEDPDDDGLTRGRDGGGRDDDFDDFEDSVQYSGGGGASGTPTQKAKDQPWDEAVELSESEGNDSPNGSPIKGGGVAGHSGVPPGGRPRADAVQNQPFDEAHDLTSEGSVDEDDEDDVQQPRVVDANPAAANSAKSQMQSSQGMSGARQADFGSMRAPVDDHDDDPDDHPPPRGGQHQSQAMPGLQAMPEKNDDDDYGGAGGEEGGAVVEGMYDPAEYASLNVSAEIKELFQYITRYKPHAIELETKMRPFIPDYIPSVGDIDPFIKVPRPDGKADNLGLVSLDEPASVQSDPTVLTLQLRAVSKSSGAQPMLVRAVENAEKDPKAITGWVNSIADLHRHKPAPSVRYSKPMPDIEALMQIWPAPIEELLEGAALPDADINLDLASYVRMVSERISDPRPANCHASACIFLAHGCSLGRAAWACGPSLP